MSLLNPENVFDESWILFFLTRLFGLRVFEENRRRWISYLYAIFITVLYWISFFMIEKLIWHHYESMESVIYYFENLKFQGYFNLFVLPAIIFLSIVESSKDSMAYKKLDEIDRALLYLNSRIDNHIEMTKDMICLSIYVFITIFVNLFTYFSLVTPDCGYIFYISWFLHFFPIFLEIITLCAFDIFVEKIRVRFKQINRVIGGLLEPRKISVILVHQSTDINNASKLRLARRIHLKLHDAASTINKTYGLRLFLIFFVTLISVLNYFLKALSLIGNYLTFLDSVLYVIWTCFHIGKYFHIAISCQATMTEAKLATGFFYEASSSQGSNGFRAEANALSRQLINQQLQFNVYNVFSINFPKGITILITVLTYFLLLA